MSPGLVIGLGSPDGGDDAVGLWVARRVAELAPPDVVVVEHEDPTGLIDLWRAAELAVVVDAVRSGSRPGTLFVLDAGKHAEPLTPDAWASTGRGGTHAFGLAAAVELGRALHSLPDRLVLVGIEAATMEHGVGLSPAVGAAIDAAVAAVSAVVAADDLRVGVVADVSG
ncbi:MAG: hydrogenase maturation protease [Cellulomonas sp.]